MTSPDPTAGIQDAARHLAAGQPAEAAAVLDDLVQVFPSYVTAHVLLAKAREAAGQVEEALDAWHAAYFLMSGSPLIARERQRLLRADVEPAEVPKVKEREDLATDTEEAAPPEAVSQEHEGESPEDEGSAEAAADEVVVGGEPDAWVNLVDATEDAPASEALDAGETWTIIEETEVPRPSGAEAIEPTMVPPVGHPESRPGSPSGHAGDEDDVVEAVSESEEADDLDALIEQLENAPRIRPDLDFKGEDAEPEEDAATELVSETLARIYETQKQYSEAARAYALLAALHPGRRDEFTGKAEAMRRRAAENGG